MACVALLTDIDDTGRKRPYHFTYHDYVKALNGVGLSVIMLPSQDLEKQKLILGYVEGLVIPGGDDIICGDSLPEETFVWEQRQNSDVYMVKTALEMKKPILGICYGMQLINHVLGGSHHRHIPEYKDHSGGVVHKLKKVENVDFLKEKEWLQASYHHQCINKLADGLTPIIESHDGYIEAYVRYQESFIIATQWHVEKCETLSDTSILNEFAKVVFEENT